jgi:hypothetical protein
MFKESGPKNNAENFEKDPGLIDWESLDMWKIRQELFKYLTDEKKKKLKLAEEKSTGEAPNYYHFRKYIDDKGRIIRIEEEDSNSSPEDYESSNNVLEKEYVYNANGNIEAIMYCRADHCDCDQAIISNDRAGEIRFEYENGKIIGAHAVEAQEVHDEITRDNNYRGVKNSDFHVDYDANGNILSVRKETKDSNSSEIEKEIVYEKEKDQDKVYAKMNAAEIIEWHITRSVN